jgi:hypothetical protein
VPPTTSPEITIPPTTETVPEPSETPSDSLPDPDPTEPPSDPLETLTEEITPEQAADLATDPEVLAEATSEQQEKAMKYFRIFLEAGIMLAGLILVLITLSGTTRDIGVVCAIASILMYLGVSLTDDK